MKNLLMLLLVCSYCTIPLKAHSEEKGKIRIQGGIAAIDKIFNKIKAPFEKETGIELQIKESTSEAGILALENGQADWAITGITWPEIEALLQKNHEKLKHDMSEFRSRQIGRDLRKLVLNKKANVHKLTESEIAQIATGKIKNWKQVGGADYPITIVFAEKSPGLYMFWKKTVMNNQEWTKENTKTVPDLEAAKKFIQENPGAYTIVPSQAKVQGDLMMPEIPTLGTALMAYTLGNPSEKILKLYEYIQGPGKAYIGE